MNASTVRLPDSDEERRHLAWETTLDRLELDVLVGARLLAATDDALDEGTELPHLHDWEQPGDHGPIPDDLVGRAREIHARQVEVQHRLATAMAETRRRHAATERAPGGTYGSTAAPAAYLDLQA